MTATHAPYEFRTASDAMSEGDDPPDAAVLRADATAGDELSRSVLDAAGALDALDKQAAYAAANLADRCRAVEHAVSGRVRMPEASSGADGAALDVLLARRAAKLAELRSLLTVYRQLSGGAGTGPGSAASRKAAAALRPLFEQIHLQASLGHLATYDAQTIADVRRWASYVSDQDAPDVPPMPVALVAAGARWVTETSYETKERSQA